MKKQQKPALRPLVLAVQLSLCGLSFTLTAPHAQASPSASHQAAHYHLASGPLADVLARFAAQAKVQLSLDPAQLGSRQSAGLHGQYGVEAGFDKLLDGSGFIAVRTPQGYSIKPVAELPKVKVSATAPAESSGRTVAAGVNEAQLETVRVSAAANLGGSEASATSPVKGYVAKRSATATKTDTPIVETPQSISVVGAEEIKAIGATNMVETLAYTPRVINNTGFDPGYEIYILRGFSQHGGTQRDGMRYGNTGSGEHQDVYGLERVEYLKGAASVLYGAQSPGGIINSVSKRPNKNHVQELVAEYGSFNHRALKADLGGEFNDALLWRLAALINKANTQVDYVNSDRLYIAPSILWQPTASTKLTLLPFYQKSNLARVFSMPHQGTILSNPLGKVPRNLFLGEPGQDKSPNLNWGAGVEFEHVTSNNYKLTANLRSNRSESTSNISAPIFLDEDYRSVYRYAIRDAKNTSNHFNADINLHKEFDAGAVRHKLLIGVSARSELSKSSGLNWSNASFGPIDLFSPIYGQQPDFVNTGSFGSPQSSRSRNVGVYLQDQIEIGQQWRALLGGRQSWVKLDDHTNKVSQRNGNFSANAGLVYLARNGLSPYASYSESFEQEIGKLEGGSIMKPTVGKQIEVGVRWQPKGEGGPLLSLATYELRKTNLPKDDPANPDFQIQVGEVRSRGLELEAKGAFTKNLSGTVAYAYTDARTTRSTYVEEIGQRSNAVPLHQASFWLDLDGAIFNVPGLKLGTGVRYVGLLPISGKSYHVPESTTVDARLAYQYRNWRYDLNITNLLDEVSYSNCWSRGCRFNKARTITGSVAYRF